MTTAVATAPRTVRARTTLPRVIRSEWTKLWSLRSTYWTLALALVISLGFSALINWGMSSNLDQMSAHDRATVDPASASLVGLAFGQLAIAVLGVLTISSEYSTGGIKATLTAVPQRMKVLAAKAVVFLFVAVVIGLVASFSAFAVAQPFWAHQHMAPSLSDPGVLRAVIGGGLLIAGCGMFAFAVASLLRHTAGAITTAVAVLLVLPSLVGLLPGSWGDTIAKYFFTNAGQQITTVSYHDPSQLGPWPGFIAFTVEWLVLLGVGAYLMRRRDA